MQRVSAVFWVTCLCMALSLPHALADAKLPDGTTVPRDPGGSEIKLPAFFVTQGETIDWIVDAHTTPDTFSPLCNLTATLLLKESGSSLAVGWYNVNAAATA